MSGVTIEKIGKIGAGEPVDPEYIEMLGDIMSKKKDGFMLIATFDAKGADGKTRRRGGLVAGGMSREEIAEQIADVFATGLIEGERAGAIEEDTAPNRG